MTDKTNYHKIIKYMDSIENLKKIWKDEYRFVTSQAVFIYEISGTSYRQLQPTFENEFWEIYSLHRESGLYYAIIGKHNGIREFYKKEILFSRTGRFWFPIGRDLAVKAMGDVHWEIISVKSGRLETITEQFLPFRHCVVTSVEYTPPVLGLVVKAPTGSQYEGKVYWKQEDNGYEPIAEKDLDKEYAK